MMKACARNEILHQHVRLVEMHLSTKFNEVEMKVYNYKLYIFYEEVSLLLY